MNDFDFCKRISLVAFMFLHIFLKQGTDWILFESVFMGQRFGSLADICIYWGFEVSHPHMNVKHQAGPLCLTFVDGGVGGEFALPECLEPSGNFCLCTYW